MMGTHETTLGKAFDNMGSLESELVSVKEVSQEESPSKPQVV